MIVFLSFENKCESQVSGCMLGRGEIAEDGG
jgi:hypothetical protein